MRILYMGTPQYAVPALKALAASSAHEVIGVFTGEDAASGRGKTLRPTEVKQAALQLDLPVYTPRSLRSAETVSLVKTLNPDVIVVAAYGKILPKEVLDIPRFGCLNIHGSELPRWRGAAPVQRAIFSGDGQVGVCIMKMEEGLDTGDYHAAGHVDVADKTTEQLEGELAQLGADELMNALPHVEAGTYEWVQQDEQAVTYAEKILKHEMLLKPQLARSVFLRRVQASTHRAPARCCICGIEAQVIQARPSDEGLAAGSVLIQKKHMLLGLADGAVELLRVKPQGKKEMDAMQWANGLRNKEAIWQALEGDE